MQSHDDNKDAKTNVPDSVVKLSWEVNTRSIQEEILSKVCFGSLMTRRNPNCLVISSTVSPFKQDLSQQYQLFDLTLNSLMITSF